MPLDYRRVLDAMKAKPGQISVATAGVTSADVRELLEVKRMHLTVLLVMTCGVVGGGHAQETERRGARQFPVVLPCDRRSVS